MPFMIGSVPIRRTLNYLQAGKLILKDKIQIFSINYNTRGAVHKGAREFVFWYLPQIQYKNPNVQVVTLRNITPTPFIKCYWEDGKNMLIDIDSKSKNAILTHLIKVVGKSYDILSEEAKEAEEKINKANFGIECEKHCICEVWGQVPCPGIVPVPYQMRGKYGYSRTKKSTD